MITVAGADIILSMFLSLSDFARRALPSAHLGYQQDLERNGVLVLAGPLSDPSGEVMAGAGLINYRAGSMDEARKIADNDPMHKAGARTYTLRKWLVNEGNISLNIGLSTRTVDLS